MHCKRHLGWHMQSCLGQKDRLNDGNNNRQLRIANATCARKAAWAKTQQPLGGFAPNLKLNFSITLLGH